MERKILRGGGTEMEKTRERKAQRTRVAQKNEHSISSPTRSFLGQETRGEQKKKTHTSVDDETRYLGTHMQHHEPYVKPIFLLFLWFGTKPFISLKISLYT
mmetsp:Transcript_30756/g.80464  ORF Transcript_30756/g.80464 Transcript_30756/m.80464 type:complete len:101 (-) Transcript_30756:141-443(-)